MRVMRILHLAMRNRIAASIIYELLPVLQYSNYLFVCKVEVLEVVFFRLYID